MWCWGVVFLGLRDGCGNGENRGEMGNGTRKTVFAVILFFWYINMFICLG